MARAAVALLLLLGAPPRAPHRAPRPPTAANTSAAFETFYSDIHFYESNDFRYKRESHPLIGPFDISNMFRKRNRLKEGTPPPTPPTASPLLSARATRPAPATERSAAATELTAAAATEITAGAATELAAAAATEITAPQHTTVSGTDTTLITDRHITANKNKTIDDSSEYAAEANDFNISVRTDVNKSNFEVNTTVNLKTSGAAVSVADVKPEDIQNVKLKNKSKHKNKISRKSKSVVTTEPQPTVAASNASDSETGAGAGAHHAAADEGAWPVKRAAVLEGDIILGGLMMVHGRAAGGGAGGARCGPLMAQGGVQALEAMLFALDEAARAQLLPPGVRLGALVLDDCDSDTRGLEMALDFIKGSISNIDAAESGCNSSAVRKVISGVVGAASSVTSVQVANLLRLFKIPQVSYFSTSPELSNKARFEYFTRTIPSDLHQARAMVAIVKRFGWRYVSIIYEESNYGIKAFEELETLLQRDDICIAVKERLAKDSGAADERAYDAIVDRLLSRPRARGVIVFGSDQEVARVMAAARRRGAARAFGWVGSDGWSARALVSAGHERVVEGTVSVQPQARPVRGFREYFLALRPHTNRRNPWFVEFWEEQFRCRLAEGAGGAGAGGAGRAQYAPCSGRERLSADNTEFEAQLQFVADAVWAFVYAIRDMHRALCGPRAGLCGAMRPVSGPALLRYLRQVRFVGLSGDEFQFDAHGDGPARYNILHFKRVARAVYRWVNVGQYRDGELQLRMDEIQFKWDEPQHPESVCSAECELGQAKQYVEGESCCWHCFNCTQYEIRSPELETACQVCPWGTLPDVSKTHCRPIPEAYLRPDSAWAIGAMSFSSVGILLTAFVCGVWVRHSSTPVVRASGRELSYVLLAGILMCYLVTFALVFRPTDILCSIQRFGTGFCFTVVYAALLTKTNRISRIFNASKHSAKRPILISPSSQLAICSALVSIQVLIVVVWMIVAPARAMFHYPTREDNMLVCDSYVDASYTIAFFYPVVLIVVCTVYAVLTRKIPEAFNESKHIGFTMYTTCVIWLAFVPLYFGTASHVPLRITSMAVTISLSASVTLVCLFSPKLYIILIRPERNVRQSIMPVRYSHKPPTTLTLPHPANRKPPCADKGTQTDPAEFNKLANGQTILAKDGGDVQEEKKDVSEKLKDKSEKIKDYDGVKCNSAKVSREDKKVRAPSEKLEGL